MPKANTYPTSDGRPAATIAAQIEELLRIRREAERTAAFLIDILDEAEPDRDLEDGADLEEEHDGREPDDEASDLDLYGEGDELDLGEGALAPEKGYRERLRQRRGERAGRAAS